MNRRTTKPTKWHVRPAKTQISPVWSESSLCAQYLVKGQCFVMRTTKTLVRLGWSESSLDAQVILLVLSCSGSNLVETGYSKIYKLTCASSEDSYHKAHISFCWFCRAAAHIIMDIRPVCSESSLSTWRRFGSLATSEARSEYWSDWVSADMFGLNGIHHWCSVLTGKFKISNNCISFIFEYKYQVWVCVFFVWTRGTKLFDFADAFRFARLLLIRHVQIRKRPIFKTFGDGMWEKKSITDVQCRQENSNPQVHRSSEKLGKPRFLLERWTLGLGFPCHHWTPMMDSILPSASKSSGDDSTLAALVWEKILYLSTWRLSYAASSKICLWSADQFLSSNLFIYAYRNYRWNLIACSFWHNVWKKKISSQNLRMHLEKWH